MKNEKNSSHFPLGFTRVLSRIHPLHHSPTSKSNMNSLPPHLRISNHKYRKNDKFKKWKERQSNKGKEGPRQAANFANARSKN